MRHLVLITDSVLPPCLINCLDYNLHTDSTLSLSVFTFSLNQLRFLAYHFNGSLTNANILNLLAAAIFSTHLSDKILDLDNFTSSVPSKLLNTSRKDKIFTILLIVIPL